MAVRRRRSPLISFHRSPPRPIGRTRVRQKPRSGAEMLDALSRGLLAAENGTRGGTVYRETFPACREGRLPKAERSREPNNGSSSKNLSRNINRPLLPVGVKRSRRRAAEEALNPSTTRLDRSRLRDRARFFVSSLSALRKRIPPNTGGGGGGGDPAYRSRRGKNPSSHRHARGRCIAPRRRRVHFDDTYERSANSTTFSAENARHLPTARIAGFSKRAPAVRSTRVSLSLSLSSRATIARRPGPRHGTLIPATAHTRRELGASWLGERGTLGRGTGTQPASRHRVD